MKRNCVLFTFMATLVLIATEAVSQRMRYDDAKITYTRLPLEPLNKDIKTYFIEFIYGSEISNEEADQVNKHFKDFVCEPLTRDFTGNARGKDDVLFVRVYLKPFHSDQPVIHEESMLTSGGDRKSYYYTITYEYPMRLEVYVGNGKEPIYNAFDSAKKYTYTSGKESTPGLRATDFHGASIYEGMKENAIRANMERIKEAVRSRYAYSVLTVGQKVWSPKTTKKVDYTELDSAQNKALRAFSTIKPGVDGLAEYRELIKEPISIWLTALKESNLEDKKARINAEVTSIIRHNLAYAYYWLGEVDKAKEQVAIAMREFTDTSWMEEINKQIEDYQKRRAVNQ